jgi:hypothetical protein
MAQPNGIPSLSKMVLEPAADWRAESRARQRLSFRVAGLLICSGRCESPALLFASPLPRSSMPRLWRHPFSHCLGANAVSGGMAFKPRGSPACDISRIPVLCPPICPVCRASRSVDFWVLEGRRAICLVSFARRMADAAPSLLKRGKSDGTNHLPEV